LLRQFLDGMGRERALLLADEDAVTVNIHPAVGSADQDADRPLRGLVRLPEEAPPARRRGKRLPAGVGIDRSGDARMDDCRRRRMLSFLGVSHRFEST